MKKTNPATKRPPNASTRARRNAGGSTTTTTTTSGGAAEEPEPASTTSGGAAEEPEPASTTAATTTYNVRDYQNPDAGADQPLTKAKAKGKKDGTPVCFHCGKADPKLLSCAACHHARYCDRDCQRKDWKRHKLACKAAVAAEKRRVRQKAAWKAAAAAARRRGGRGGDVVCVICIGPVVAPVELPCGHSYCGACLAELRAREVSQRCPQCREELPAGAEGLYDLAVRPVIRIDGMVNRGERAWGSLPAAEAEEIEEAIAMLREAGAQGHAAANTNLGFLLEHERKDVDGAEQAYRAAIEADPGYASAHVNLGYLLQTERKDVDGAEQAYRAAIEADPGYAAAHYNLALLLEDERQDVDGAEQAYRAAIEADPGYVRLGLELTPILLKLYNCTNVGNKYK